MNAFPSGSAMLQWGRRLRTADMTNIRTVSSATYFASMGPPSEDGGYFLETGYFRLRNGASMGPPSEDGGYLDLVLAVVAILEASMGPPSEDGGYPDLGLALAGHDIASMGPPSEDGGYPTCQGCASSGTSLQWGRRLRTADIRHWQGTPRSTTGFNGAAV